MSIRTARFSVLFSTVFYMGCVGLTTQGRSGITVHDPTYYLVVAGSGATQVIEMFVGPDFDSTYTVSGERSFFMKNEFTVKLSDGMLRNFIGMSQRV